MVSFLELFLIYITYMVSRVSPGAVHSLHWNSTNPIFRIDNTDHIVDVNSGNLPWEYDQLNIICPVQGLGRGTRGREEGERYIIYNVSKEEYDSCRISQLNPRVVAVCDRPDRQLQFTITFRSFSPTPRGLEFRPGQDYYFISTSSRSDLHRRVGGSCSSHNMKVIFKVAKSDGNIVQRQPTINRPRMPPDDDRDATDQIEKDHERPISRVRSIHGGLRKDRREEIKQEASTMSSSSSVSPILPLVFLITFLRL